jgi:2,5-diketo-D-gluconate reductase A
MERRERVEPPSQVDFRSLLYHGTGKAAQRTTPSPPRLNQRPSFLFHTARLYPWSVLGLVLVDCGEMLAAYTSTNATNAHALGLCPSRSQVGACPCTCASNPLLCPPLRSYCWPVVPILPGEQDPAASPCTADDGLHELRATPRIEQSGYAKTRVPAMDNLADPRWSKNLLAVLRPGDALLNNEYATLISALSRKVGAALDDPAQTKSSFSPGVQHIYTLPALNGLTGLTGKDASTLRPSGRVDFRAELEQLVHDYARPIASRELFGGAPAQLTKLVVSRSVHLPNEVHRTRAMLWHYDGLPEKVVKLLFYLTPVPSNRSGCMLAMRHNETDLPFKMKYARNSPWGKKLKPVSIAQPWMTDLLDRGYRPRCITGPPGTIVAFHTNIVHRGSRPAAGMSRDCVLLELTASSRPSAAEPAVEASTVSSTTPPLKDDGVHRRLKRLPLPTPEPSLQVAPQWLTTPVRAADGATRPMPMIGFGTANRRSAKGPALIASLKDFLELGGRLVDTAQMYRNYAEIGIALSSLSDASIRESAWVVSKVNTNRHMKGFVNTAEGAQGAVIECLNKTGLKVLDVMLIHLPWENSAEERAAVWRGLIEAQRTGRVRHIGVSNYNREQIEQLVAATGVWPSVNELEYHPWVQPQAHELVTWCQQHQIVVVAYGSLGGSKNRGQRSATVLAVAKRHGVTNAHVLLRWALQRGVVVIPGATSRKHISDNLALQRVSPLSLRLGDEEMRAIETSGKPTRFKVWKGLCTEGGRNESHAEECKPTV